MFGRRPYTGKNKMEIREQIFKHQVAIKRTEIPPGWSIEAADFINKLLQRKPALRLGLQGPDQVKQHIWLKEVDWQGLIEKKVPAPSIPSNTLILITLCF
jgi:serine/threonine protein kinase